MKLIYNGENLLNIPNLLSFYRFVAAPFVIYFAYTGQERLFVILICISLVSDALDGSIARYFKLQTKFGASLDNLADTLTMAAAVYGIYVFKWDLIRPHAWILIVFMAIFILSIMISLIRFGKMPGLHLYLSVSSAYAQSVFLFVLFAFDFYPWFFFLVIIWGILAYSEKIIILLKIKSLRTGIKGLYSLKKTEKGS